ncbi:jg12861 [Pararge aegeria aegeria]|uniref:Metalloendopeptidase n=1 Tax=Pararge aegeria aegeria TaxID=348720 RepID=A0A8S4S8C1_9NEOP|nr:jg12861 [Pararge aegeria aegeria]
MNRSGLLLLFIGLAACSPPVTKSKEKIEEFRQYLENSRIDDGVLLESRKLAGPDALAWENSGKYQGDILLDDSQLEDLVADFAGVSDSGNRNAFIVANTRWPSNIMIYQIGANEFTSAQQQAIRTAMSWIEHFSCVRFRRRTNERVFVRMTGNPTGCYAHVGFSTAHPNRVLNLARNSAHCFRHVVIIHELLHSLGFQHMHQTHERDTYVRINWNNVISGQEFAFTKYNRNQVSLHGLPYEYTSAMHYHNQAFSRNRQPTITALRTFSGTMGQRDHATYWDWLRLRRHYNCPGAWTRSTQDLKDEVERTLPLIKMNLPAPERGPFTDVDNAYVEALLTTVDEDTNNENTFNEEVENFNEDTVNED